MEHSRVGHGLVSSMDWIRFDWVGLPPITSKVKSSDGDSKLDWSNKL